MTQLLLKNVQLTSNFEVSYPKGIHTAYELAKREVHDQLTSLTESVNTELKTDRRIAD